MSTDQDRAARVRPASLSKSRREVPGGYGASQVSQRSSMAPLGSRTARTSYGSRDSMTQYLPWSMTASEAPAGRSGSPFGVSSDTCAASWTWTSDVLTLKQPQQATARAHDAARNLIARPPVSHEPGPTCRRRSEAAPRARPSGRPS